MKLFIILMSMFSLMASAASTKSFIYECSDERDSSLIAVLYVGQNWGKTSQNQAISAVEVFQNNRLISSERGRFVPAGCSDTQQGSVNIRCEIEFYPVGSRQSLGVVTNVNGQYGRIVMELADRQFRGNCFTR